VLLLLLLLLLFRPASPWWQALHDGSKCTLMYHVLLLQRRLTLQGQDHTAAHSTAWRSTA
jgi:hypothetical protein